MSEGTAECVSVSPNGKHFATCGTRGHASIWDVTTGEHVRSLEGAGGHRYYMKDVSWMCLERPEGNMVATQEMEQFVCGGARQVTYFMC